MSVDTIGVPVISIGIPTVVDAVTITSDTIDFILKHLGREMREGNRPKMRWLRLGLALLKKEADG